MFPLRMLLMNVHAYVNMHTQFGAVLHICKPQIHIANSCLKVLKYTKTHDTLSVECLGWLKFVFVSNFCNYKKGVDMMLYQQEWGKIQCECQP